MKRTTLIKIICCCAAFYVFCLASTWDYEIEANELDGWKQEIAKADAIAAENFRRGKL